MMLYKIVEVMRSGQMGRGGVRDWRVGGGESSGSGSFDGHEEVEFWNIR